MSSEVIDSLLSSSLTSENFSQALGVLRERSLPLESRLQCVDRLSQSVVDGSVDERVTVLTQHQKDLFGAILQLTVQKDDDVQDEGYRGEVLIPERLVQILTDVANS